MQRSIKILGTFLIEEKENYFPLRLKIVLGRSLAGFSCVQFESEISLRFSARNPVKKVTERNRNVFGAPYDIPNNKYCRLFGPLINIFTIVIEAVRSVQANLYLSCDPSDARFRITIREGCFRFGRTRHKPIYIVVLVNTTLSWPR